MVKGMDKFREYFAGHENKYAVIGGAACDLVFGSAGVPFRGSEDIDMVLCVDVVNAEFGEIFAKFLRDGGYQANERQDDGKKRFYRFHKPANDEFPAMVELLSRRDGALKLPAHIKITRIPVEENVVSLSAILLDETYYSELTKAKYQIKGVTIIDQKLLIPFKALAYLNLSGEDGTRKREVRDIEKHLYDALNLAQLLPRNSKIDIPEKMKDDLSKFAHKVESLGSIDGARLNAAWTTESAIKLLRSAYSL